MSYKVLSLKWRPQSFQDVVGQDHVTQTLVNALSQDRIAQGYIFTGPRGVGKTTTARLLAMALNSDGGPAHDFDSKSETSVEISTGRSLDVLEIDGASNRGIEEIRGLREQIKFAPMKAKFKVVIIDEVHMLTNQAFNALLRTLEEPPPHAKFIFATTDIHKVPATIISRCQRFDFNKISINIISERIQFILKSEGVESDSESIHAIAKKADGSMRDALSLIDQSIAFCGEKIQYTLITKVLGLIEQELYFDFTTAILEKDYNKMVSLLSTFGKYGVPASEVMVGIEEHVRNLIYAGVEKGFSLLEMNKELLEKYKIESVKWEKRDLFRINQVLIDTSSVIRRSDDPFLLLEMTALKLLEMDKSVLIDQLLSNNEVSKPINTKNVQVIKKKIDDNKDLKKDDKNQNNIEQKLEEATVDLNHIKESWPEVLKNIHKIRPSVGAVIEDFIPFSITDNIVVFESEVGYDFNEKLLNRGVPIIETEIKNVLGSSLKVKFLKNLENKPKSIESKNTNNKSVDEEVFNKVVDLFDGEILD